MKNKINLIASVLLITLALVSIVSAFGVSSPYWSDRPLIMARGETTIVSLSLQNMVGNKDVNVKAELVEGSEISSLKGDIFTIEAGTSSNAQLTIKMPKDSLFIA